LKEAAVPKQPPISRAEELRREVREQKKTIAALCDDIDRLDQDCREMTKAWWIAHMLLGFPELRGKDLFHDVCLRRIAELMGVKPSKVRRWMKMDMHNLAVFTQRKEDDHDR
jgi:hypothetical protein